MEQLFEEGTNEGYERNKTEFRLRPMVPTWIQSAVKQQNPKPFKSGIYKGNDNPDSTVTACQGLL
jgi:hypothetical protein